jgi:hypothetical protein
MTLTAIPDIVFPANFPRPKALQNLLVAVENRGTHLSENSVVEASRQHSSLVLTHVSDLELGIPSIP